MNEKKTKVVATISDLNCGVDFLEKLYSEGMNVVRLNTAHQSIEGSLKVIKNVREVSDKIPILIDTKGPEIRTNKIENEWIFKKGEKIIIKGDKDKLPDGKILYVSYVNIAKDVDVGKTILIDDGEMEFEVIKKQSDSLICRVMNDGKLRGRKTVNIPGVKVKLASITKKDIEYIEFACKHDVEFIAHSFVRNKEDVLSVQKILDKYKSKAKIIAKIENQEGVDNLEEILDYSYGVMVARGDLGVEVAAEKIPKIQFDIVKRCIERKKPVIVATQMLHTMIENPRPTRAEISDVANAIRMGSDAVMLSGETAYGKYPINAVKVMSNVAHEVEKEFSGKVKNLPRTAHDKDIPVFLSRMAVVACSHLPIRVIVTDTLSGRTARYLSSFRGDKLIFANCYDKIVAKQLALSRGVYATYIKKTKDRDEFVHASIKYLLKKKKMNKSDLILILAGSFGPSNGASFVEIASIEDLSR
jgi:pyruvate kinase